MGAPGFRWLALVADDRGPVLYLPFGRVHLHSERTALATTGRILHCHGLRRRNDDCPQRPKPPGHWRLEFVWCVRRRDRGHVPCPIQSSRPRAAGHPYAQQRGGGFRPRPDPWQLLPRPNLPFRGLVGADGRGHCLRGQGDPGIAARPGGASPTCPSAAHGHQRPHGLRGYGRRLLRYQRHGRPHPHCHPTPPAICEIPLRPLAKHP